MWRESTDLPCRLSQSSAVTTSAGTSSSRTLQPFSNGQLCLASTPRYLSPLTVNSKCSFHLFRIRSVRVLDSHTDFQFRMGGFWSPYQQSWPFTHQIPSFPKVKGVFGRSLLGCLDSSKEHLGPFLLVGVFTGADNTLMPTQYFAMNLHTSRHASESTPTFWLGMADSLLYLLHLRCRRRNSNQNVRFELIA